MKKIILLIMVISMVMLEEQDPDNVNNQQQGSMISQLVFSIREPEHVVSENSNLLSNDKENIWIPFIKQCTIQFGVYI